MHLKKEFDPPCPKKLAERPLGIDGDATVAGLAQSVEGGQED